MNFCIDAEQLRKALKEIEAAESNGFNHCLCVFRMYQAGYMLSDNQAVYSDLIERASPTDGSLNWGRNQGVSKRYRFDGKKLAPIAQEAPQ